MITEKNYKKKIFSEVMTQWKNGANYFTITTIINNYAEEINPQLSSYGYSSRLNPEEWDALVDSLITKTYIAFKNEVEDAIYKTLKNKYERMRAAKPRLMTNNQIHDDIRKNGAFYSVKDRLFDILDVWDVIDEAAAVIEDQKTNLGKFVNDRQNVHTRFVNRQTDAALAALSKVVVKKKQQTLDEIISCWREKYMWDDIQPLFKDMTYWGGVSEVIKEDDYAYRVTLRALWAKIKTYEGDIRKELEARLFEECRDSVGMCAQGHLSRLGNVFVGFEETGPVILSFQDKMAAISLQDVDESVKIAEATKIMDEMKMPHEERNAWLEAF